MQHFRNYMIGAFLFSLLFSLLFLGLNPDWISPLLPYAIALTASGLIWITISQENCLLLNNGRFSRESYILIVIIAVLLTVLPRAVVSLFHLSGSFWTPCLSLDPLPAQMECLIHSAYNQNYGLRNILSLIVALLLGITGFYISRSGRDRRHILWSVVVLVAVIHNILGLVMIALGKDQLLPWLFWSYYGKSRFAFFFPNPSWIWPYLVPSFSLTVYGTFFSLKHLHRIFSFLASFLIAAGIMLTQQRGGFILILGSIIIVIFFFSAQKRRIWLLFAGLVTSVLVLVIWKFDIINSILSLAGLEWNRDPFSISWPRIEIWMSAWKIFLKHPLSGEGYASWFLSITRMARVTGLEFVLDSAHNHFVQLFVELGLIQGGAIVFVMGLIAKRAYLNLKSLSGGALLFFLSAFATLLVMLVQEVDYTYPVRFGFVLFWGSLVGAYNPELSTETIKVSGMRMVGRIIVFIGLLLWILYFLFMGKGAYAYEGIPEIPDTKMIRWLRHEASIPVYSGNNGLRYAVYEIRFPGQTASGKPQVYSIEWEGNKQTISVENSNENYYFPALSGGELIPEFRDISFSETYIDNARISGGQLLYPPVYSSMAIFKSSGTGRIYFENDEITWENDGSFRMTMGSHESKALLAPSGCKFLNRMGTFTSSIRLLPGKIVEISGICHKNI